MIYLITKIIMRLATHGYFRHVHVIGHEHIPDKGPAIFISNHPSALLDPIVIATHMKRSLHFIAAAEYFGKGFTRWLLMTQFNMIPVFRPDQGDKKSNEDVFRFCYESLARGKSILIFAEGTSETVKWLRPLKTGAVRMKLGTERFVKHEFEVPIIPVGLNYKNPHEFQRDVLISFGKPVDLSDYDGQTLNPEQEDYFDHVRSMTEDCAEALKQNVIHIEDHELAPLVSKVETIFSHSLIEQLKIRRHQSERYFQMRKDLIKAVAHFAHTQPEQTHLMEKDLDEYFERMEQLHLTERALDEPDTRYHALQTIGQFLGLPLFVLGMLINGVPYLISRRIFRKKLLPVLNDPEKQILGPVFSGSIAFSLGTVLFLIWYLVLSILASFQLNWLVGVGTFFGSYFMGQFVLYYIAGWINLRARRRLRLAFDRSRDELAKLITLRKRILSKLEAYKEAYVTL